MSDKEYIKEFFDEMSAWSKVKQYGSVYQSCVGKVKYGHEQTARDAAKAMEAKYLPCKI